MRSAGPAHTKLADQPKSLNAGTLLHSIHICDLTTAAGPVWDKVLPLPNVQSISILVWVALQLQSDLVLTLW